MRRKPQIKLVTCHSCHGTGNYKSGLHLTACPECYGSGRREACEQKRLQAERRTTGSAWRPGDAALTDDGPLDPA
jgi:DnaJ-class molecular chaperone